MDDIFNLNPLYSTLIATIIGFALIDDFTVAEQNAIGNWLILSGQVVLSNAAAQAVVEQRASGNIININSKSHKENYCPFKYDVQIMREILKKTNPKHSNNAISLLERTVAALEKEIKELKEMKKD